jgi:hypothetical protein
MSLVLSVLWDFRKYSLFATLFARLFVPRDVTGLVGEQVPGNFRTRQSELNK